MNCPRHLRYATDEQPGITRKKRGRGFTYLDQDGNRISTAATLRRIKDLSIPPAWRKVWISPGEDGHLQCTGIDLKNRKQYIYHPDWVAYRKDTKFEKLSSFGKLLPLIRESVIRDMHKDGWPREKVLALVVHLMDRYYFRVGQQKYARQNRSYGITTLRRKHLRDKTDSLVIKYVGKSGKLRRVTIDNMGIIKKIRELSELPGYEIFRYRDERNQLHSIDASDINVYLKEISGAEITAKDFRTWGGSKLSIVFYEDVCRELEMSKGRKFETSLVRKVSKCLGNTVSVCREYYVHPEVLDVLLTLYNDGRKKLPLQQDSTRDPAEKYLLEILAQQRNE